MRFHLLDLRAKYETAFIRWLMWALLMLLFEFGLGIFVLNYSWERMLEDYDVSRGGLMGFGLLFMVFAPYLAAKLRIKKTGKL
jgi:hypothetical protein